MMIYGKKNYNELINSLMIPGMGITMIQYKFLWFNIPVYKVKINYDK